MNVTFITPAPDIKRNALYRLGGHLYGHSNPITGPLVLGGILRKAGHRVEVYEELNGRVSYDRLLRETDVLCLYAMTTTFPRACDIARMFREKGHARIIMDGIYPSASPEEALPHVDQVVVGEAESVILDVVEGRITDPIVHAEPICDLDTIPFPDYSVLKTPVSCANVITSRGCPFRCTFCTTSRMFAPYRRRSVDSVIAELRMLHERGFQYMNFEDDNFTADKDRAKEICHRMIAEHLQFRETFFFGRTDMAKDPELLDLLAKAHLTRVLIGIESLNQAALDDINKGQSIADIERAGIACRDHGIRVIASVVLGIDEDSPEDIKRSVDFAKSIDAYQIQPAVLTPFPGTPVYDEFVKEGRMITKDWGLFDMTNVTFQPRRMSPWTLQECFFDACNNFYDLPSAFRIWHLFGPEYGLRRIWLAFGTSAGVPIARFAAEHFPDTPYYKLKRIPWKYAKDEIAKVPAPEPTTETAALPFEAIEKNRDLDEESRRRIAAAVAGVGAVALAMARRPTVRASIRRHSAMAALV